MTAADPREQTPEPTAPRTSKADRSAVWTNRPGGRRLARVWITVVFAVLTVAGVTAVTVIGLFEGRRAQAIAESTEVAADGVYLSGLALFAIEDERAAAAMWRAEPTLETRTRYDQAIALADEALGTLHLGWQVRRRAIDDVGPPTLADLENAMDALAELRRASLGLSPNSTVATYSGIVGLVVSMTGGFDSIATDSPLLSHIRSSVRLLRATEAMAIQRDVVVDIVGDGRDPSEEELVQISLLDQEIRSTLIAARALAPDEVRDAIGTLAADVATDDVRRMLDRFTNGEVIGLEDWRWATATRLTALRAVADRSASSLVDQSDAHREAVETSNARQALGLSALWLVSVVAGIAAVGVARERARALHEHAELADGLFEWFLPTSLPVVERVAVAARFDPASRFALAGGDWYDAYETTDGLLALTIGDVAGHGPTATAQMAQLRYLLRGITLATNGSPAAQVRRLDEAVRGASTMATVFHALLDVEQGELTYTRAGHLVGFLRRGAEVQRLDGALGPPVGAGSESGFVDEVVLLRDSSDIVLFTDGLVEERLGDIDERLSALASLLAVIGGDVESVADSMIETRLDRSDDAAVIVVSWTAPESRADGSSS